MVSDCGVGCSGEGERRVFETDGVRERKMLKVAEKELGLEVD